MAATIQEMLESRSGTFAKTHRRVYIVRGETSESAAIALAASTAPLSVDGGVLPRTGLTYEPVGRRKDTDAWRIVAEYNLNRLSGVRNTADVDISYTNSPETRSVKQSISTVTSIAPTGSTAPNHDKAINVGPDGVAGVDILANSEKYSETHRYANADFGSAERAALRALRLHVNDAAFRDWAAGEVLYLGPRITYRPASEDWEVQHDFAIQPNETSIAFGNGITLASKDGWDYVWPEHEIVPDTAAKLNVRKVIAIHVERVYPRGSFSGLGIGVLTL